MQTLKSPLPPHFPKFSWPDKGPVWRYLSLRSFEAQESSPPKLADLKASLKQIIAAHMQHIIALILITLIVIIWITIIITVCCKQPSPPSCQTQPPQFQQVTNGLSIQVIVHSCIFSSATTTLTGAPWKVTFQRSKSLVTGNQSASRLTTYPSVGLGGLLDPMTTIDTEQLLHVSDGKLSCRTHTHELVNIEVILKSSAYDIFV